MEFSFPLWPSFLLKMNKKFEQFLSIRMIGVEEKKNLQLGHLSLTHTQYLYFQQHYICLLLLDFNWD